MSEGNSKIKARKIKNKEFLSRAGSLIQPALFKEIQAANYEILVRTGTVTRYCLFVLSFSYSGYDLAVIKRRRTLNYYSFLQNFLL